MLLSPIDHKHFKRDIKGDKIELCKDFANNINGSNYSFIVLARGTSTKIFTELFTVIFHHSMSQMEALHGGKSEKPRLVLVGPRGSELHILCQISLVLSLIFTPLLNCASAALVIINFRDCWFICISNVIFKIRGN